MTRAARLLLGGFYRCGEHLEAPLDQVMDDLHDWLLEDEWIRSDELLQSCWITGAVYISRADLLAVSSTNSIRVTYFSFERRLKQTLVLYPFESDPDTGRPLSFQQFVARLQARLADWARRLPRLVRRFYPGGPTRLVSPADEVRIYPKSPQRQLPPKRVRRSTTEQAGEPAQPPRQSNCAASEWLWESSSWARQFARAVLVPVYPNGCPGAFDGFERTGAAHMPSWDTLLPTSTSPEPEALWCTETEAETFRSCGLFAMLVNVCKPAEWYDFHQALDGQVTLFDLLSVAVAVTPEQQADKLTELVSTRVGSAQAERVRELVRLALSELRSWRLLRRGRLHVPFATAPNVLKDFRWSQGSWIRGINKHIEKIPGGRGALG